MSDINAKLTFVTGMHCDAALIGIESNSKDMISDDIYDCGVYDWIAYNLEIEIPKNSTLIINVDVTPSYWGDNIDEINYAIVGEVDIKSINNHDRMVEEIAELKSHLENLVTESIALAQFKNDTLKGNIRSTDLDEPEWHDYQTIGEAGAYLAKLNQEGEE